MADALVPSGREAEPVSELDERLRHVARVAAFSAELAAALRLDLACLWEHPDGPAAHPEAPGFVTRVDALLAIAEKHAKEAQRCLRLPPVHAARQAEALDVMKIVEAGRGLEALARDLRADARVRACAVAHGTPFPGDLAPEPAPAPPPAREAPPPGSIAARLQAWMDRIAPAGGPPPAEAPRPAPPPRPPREDRALAAVEAGVALVGQVLEDVGPRMEALRLALTGSPDSAAIARLPAELVAGLPAVAAALAAGPATARAARVAIDQWQAAARQHAELALARDAARLVGPIERADILAAYDPRRLQGLVVPLSHLHLTFRSVPALAGWFPPPATRAIRALVPTAPGGVVEGPTRPTSAVALLGKPMGPRGPVEPAIIPAPAKAWPSAPASPPAPAAPPAPPDPAEAAPAPIAALLGLGADVPPAAPPKPARPEPAPSAAPASPADFLAQGPATPPSPLLYPPNQVAKPRPAAAPRDAAPPAARTPSGRLPAERPWAAAAPDPGAFGPTPADDAPDAPPELTAAEASKRRLALVAKWLTAPASVPEFGDRKLLFRVVADEHAHQQDLARHHGLQLLLMPPAADDEPEERRARRAELTKARDTAASRERQFHALMAKLTAAERPPPGRARGP